MSAALLLDRATSQAVRWSALLDAWRLGLARMRDHPQPAGFRVADWQQFKLDAFELFASHGPHLAALGWRTEELFGLDRNHAGARIAASGLARFMHGGTIVEITDQHTRIRHRTGFSLRYYRTDPQAGAVPAWELHQGEPSMTDYSTDLDAGAQDVGPWLTWHAAPTRDGTHAAGTWSVKDTAGRATVNLTANGFVFDWPNSQTGWMQTSGVTGVAPQKRWNASRGKFEKQPGDDWKRALRVPVAYTPEARAIWEQSSAAAWMGFVDLMALLREAAAGNLPNLPLIGFTGHRQVRLGAGATLVPQFKLLRYVPRPLCLTEEDAAPPASDTWGGSAAAPAKPNGGGESAAPGLFAPPAPPAPGGGPLIDDEIPFGPCVQ